MSTIATYGSHVSRALSFYYDTPNIFFAIGKTTEWANESVPPVPSIETTALLEVVGFKKVNSMKFVVPDPSAGTLIVDNIKWREVVTDTINYPNDTLKAAALRENARWLYIDTIFESSEFVGVRYRQIGIYSRGVFADGVSDSLSSYLPAQFSNYGILEVYQNRAPIYRQTDQRELVSFVIEF